MTKELRRVGVLMVMMFVALFVSTTTIQYFQSGNLHADPRNSRALYESFSAQRGDIIVGDTKIATSVPVSDAYQYQRSYVDGPLYSAVTGYSVLFGQATGLEGALNSELTGTSDSQFLNRLNEIISGQKSKGASVTLTIDAKLQALAAKLLGSWKGAIVVSQPKTGRILAMVSSPSYDPNLLASHNTAAANAAYKKLLTDPSDPLFNRAIAGNLYLPGSTFKLVVAAAALESGQYTADSAFPNPETLTLPGTTTAIQNAEGGSCGGTPTATIATAIRLSCNIPMAELAQALGQAAISAEAKKLGFGDSAFSIPLRVTPSRYPDLKGDVAALMISAYGQGQDRVTPLQMNMVASAIANGGKLMKPNLVESIVGSDASVIQQFQPQLYSTTMSEATAESVTQMMRSSVAGGAASNATINGVQVAGKTGTAQTGIGQATTLWFTGFAPADDPQVAVTVTLENPSGAGFGNTYAAPMAKQLMEAVIGK